MHPSAHKPVPNAGLLIGPTPIRRNYIYPDCAKRMRLTFSQIKLIFPKNASN